MGKILDYFFKNGKGQFFPGKQFFKPYRKFHVNGTNGNAVSGKSDFKYNTLYNCISFLISFNYSFFTHQGQLCLKLKTCTVFSWFAPRTMYGPTLRPFMKSSNKKLFMSHTSSKFRSNPQNPNFLKKGQYSVFLISTRTILCLFLNFIIPNF